MIDSRPQRPTSLDELPDPRKTRHRATFEDEYLQESELGTMEDVLHSTTERMDGSSKKTTSEARESRPKPQSLGGERSLNKIFDDCLRTVYHCAYSQAREDLVPGSSGGNKRTQLEAKVGAYYIFPPQAA